MRIYKLMMSYNSHGFVFCLVYVFKTFLDQKKFRFKMFARHAAIGKIVRYKLNHFGRQYLVYKHPETTMVRG